jgi:peptide/nickel transport system substrate-binding protein
MMSYTNTKRKIVICLFFVIFTIGFIGLPNLVENSTPPKNPKDRTKEQIASDPSTIIFFRSSIIYGTMYGPQDADPQYMWDSASFDYAYQVFEGLFAYNLTEPSLALIPRLAADFGTWSGANYTVPLRQNVTFHSGYKFNASAVKFSFDRLLYLTNLTGAQPAESTIYGRSINTVLYMWPNGSSVLNHTEIIDEYTVKFVLNAPYGVFLSLLAFTASMILDPSVTPADDYICDGMSGATSDSISGTGPWVFEYYIAGVEAKFTRNDDYWRGPGAVEELFFSVIQDSEAQNSALLAGDVDILLDPHPSYYDTMKSDPNIDLIEAGPGTITQYLSFNNPRFNKTWRAAMSWAIDYDYMIDELLEGEAVRLKSPIPLGIQYADWSFDVPVLNVTKARMYMNQMGFGTTYTTDAEWINAAENNPFRTVNFTYHLGNKFREDMYVLLVNNFKQIGIKVEDAGLEWDPYLDRLYNRIPNGWDCLDIWFIEWMPDYNDPSNYVNSLMSNVSSSNSAQINDPTLEAYILAGLQETNQTQREIIYKNLQQYVVEDLMPWAFSYVGKNHDAWSVALEGFPSNGMGYAYFYPCNWDFSLPSIPIINNIYDILLVFGGLCAIILIFVVYKMRFKTQ